MLLSSHLYLGLPLGLVVKGFHLNIFLFTQYCTGDKIEKNEMGEACSAYGGEEKRLQGYGGEN